MKLFWPRFFSTACYLTHMCTAFSVLQNFSNPTTKLMHCIRYKFGVSKRTTRRSDAIHQTKDFSLRWPAKKQQNFLIKSDRDLVEFLTLDAIYILIKRFARCKIHFIIFTLVWSSFIPNAVSWVNHLCVLWGKSSSSLGNPEVKYHSASLVCCCRRQSVSRDLIKDLLEAAAADHDAMMKETLGRQSLTFCCT